MEFSDVEERGKKCRRMLNRGTIKRNSPKDLKKVILNEEFPSLSYRVSIGFH